MGSHWIWFIYSYNDREKCNYIKIKTREERWWWWNKKEEGSSLPQNAECDQLGHMRFNCPVFKRRMEKSDKMNFKEKKEKKGYITWEDNVINYSSDSEKKIISLGIMMKDYENGEEQSRYIYSNFSPNTWHASKFIHISPQDKWICDLWRQQTKATFLPRKMNLKNSEYVIYGDNKGHLINKPNKWYLIIPTSHLSLIDYFWCLFSTWV